MSKTLGGREMVDTFAYNDTNLAIYDHPGSFSDRWIEICSQRKIPYITVDMFDDDLFAKLRHAKTTAFLCHPPMADRRTSLAARAIIQSLALMHMKVFPKPEEFWHFDDKLSQKYLFEAADIFTPATHIFFNRRDALEWVKTAKFPCVFKLKAGAGSVNVSLIRNRREAKARIARMFGRGYAPHDSAIRDITHKMRLHRAKRDWLATLKRSPQTMYTLWRNHRDLDRERGYVYFQEFIDGNSYDIRVAVIGNRAFADRRMVRPGDFRASGSGMYDYDPASIDIVCVKEAFEAVKRIGATCMAFDFVKRTNEERPLIVEMSFGFSPDAASHYPGYWRSDMSWHEGHVWAQDAILDDLIDKPERQRITG